MLGDFQNIAKTGALYSFLLNQGGQCQVDCQSQEFSDWTCGFESFGVKAFAVYHQYMLLMSDLQLPSLSSVTASPWLIRPEWLIWSCTNDGS